MKLKLIKTILMGAVSVATLSSTPVAASEYTGNVAEASQSDEASTEVNDLLATIQLIGDPVTMEPVVEATASTTEDTTQQSEEQEQTEELVIATVDNYVNIRDAGSLDGNIIGKLYDHSVGTLLDETADGWYHIQSGTVDGYVKAEYVLRGEEAKALADQVGQHLATVNTTTLKVRMEPSTDAKVLGLVPDGDTLAVLDQTDGWVKVSTEEGEGYVSTDYVEVYTKNTEAESIEEEQARLAKEAEERRLAQEAAQKEVAKQDTQKTESTTTAKSTTQDTTTQAAAGTQTSAAADSSSSAAAETQTASSSSIGRQIADYGLQFVGNPYVYGGTSLTNGADCSGFVMSVYQHFGISLPRTSGQQGQSGTAVSGIENAQPGDLIWYSGHIAIYIGDGKIVHASNASDGIKVSSATYTTILSIRRIV